MHPRIRRCPDEQIPRWIAGAGGRPKIPRNLSGDGQIDGALRERERERERESERKRGGAQTGLHSDDVSSLD